LFRGIARGGVRPAAVDRKELQVAFLLATDGEGKKIFEIPSPANDN